MNLTPSAQFFNFSIYCFQWWFQNRRRRERLNPSGSDGLRNTQRLTSFHPSPYYRMTHPQRQPQYEVEPPSLHPVTGGEVASNSANIEASGHLYEPEFDPSPVHPLPAADIYQWQGSNESTNQQQGSVQSAANQFQFHYQSQNSTNSANSAQYGNTGGSIPFQWNPYWNNQSHSYQSNTQNMNYYEQLYNYSSDASETYYHHQ